MLKKIWTIGLVIILMLVSVAIMAQPKPSKYDRELQDPAIAELVHLNDLQEEALKILVPKVDALEAAMPALVDKVDNLELAMTKLTDDFDDLKETIKTLEENGTKIPDKLKKEINKLNNRLTAAGRVQQSELCNLFRLALKNDPKTFGETQLKADLKTMGIPYSQIKRAGELSQQYALAVRLYPRGTKKADLVTKKWLPMAYAVTKGKKGDRGPQGPQGPKGDRGPAGPQGPRGRDGRDVDPSVLLGLQRQILEISTQEEQKISQLRKEFGESFVEMIKATKKVLSTPQKVRVRFGRDGTTVPPPLEDLDRLAAKYAELK